jgi:cysteine desulfurase
MNRVYFDYNATAPEKPCSIEARAELSGLALNPSSIHAEGREARRITENCRRTIAEALGCFPKEVVFTGSGTESNNMVLRQFSGAEVAVSAVEHASVYKYQGVRHIPVDKNGHVLMGELENLLSGGFGIKLVSVMFANNETGIIQPIAEIASLCRKHGVLFHTDASQALGRVSISFADVESIGSADFVTLTAHKCGGPSGIAALLVRQGVDFQPLMVGGGQEYNKRPGTENVAAINGFAALVSQIEQDIRHMKNIAEARLNMEAKVQESGGVIIGADVERLPNTSSIIMPGMPSETQLMAFDLAGVSVSSGSACTSGRVEPSHVLMAMGLSDDKVKSAIRISSGWNTLPKEYDIIADAWIVSSKKTRK